MKKILSDKKGLIVYVTTLILAVVSLIIGRNIANTDNETDFSLYDNATAKASITKITDRVEEDFEISDGNTYTSIDIYFEAILLEGRYRGQLIRGYQNINNFFFSQVEEISEKDKIVVGYNPDEEVYKWYFVGYVRFDTLMYLIVIFAVALLVFGKFKGLNTLISLGFTVGVIFLVFLPAVLSGKNIYLWTALCSLYVVLMTLLLVSGLNRKSVAAAAGCLSGITVTALLTVFMDKTLALTGLVNEESVYLTYISADKPIDLTAIVFASIVIGALGALMDVSMSIASSLWEIMENAPETKFKALLKSGFSIGQDVMGTMANTLVLAYIGGSLSVILLLIAYSTSFTELVNREMIITEILQAVVGSLGILITMPLTSLLCAIMYIKNK